MSGSQRILKIISIILIVWSIAVMLFGAIIAAGSAVPGISGETMNVDGTVVDMASMAITLGVTTIASGAVDLVIGLLGLRAAKNPHKSGLFFVICIIGLVLSLIGVVLDVMQASFQWADLVSLVIIAVCTYLASSIRKQA